jgi:hypothetical protein
LAEYGCQLYMNDCSRLATALIRASPRKSEVRIDSVFISANQW